jgi:hypothetical protein
VWSPEIRRQTGFPQAGRRCSGVWNVQGVFSNREHYQESIKHPDRQAVALGNNAEQQVFRADIIVPRRRASWPLWLMICLTTGENLLFISCAFFPGQV